MNRTITQPQVHSSSCVTRRDWYIAVAIGGALSLGVWHELLKGGGIVGGNVDQKTLAVGGYRILLLLPYKEAASAHDPRLK